MADPRLIAIVHDAQRWLTPPAATAADRAEAGAEAVRLADKLLRAALRAGIASGPGDRFGRLILSLETELRDETAALQSWAALGLDETAAIAAE